MNHREVANDLDHLYTGERKGYLLPATEESRITYLFWYKFTSQYFTGTAFYQFAGRNNRFYGVDEQDAVFVPTTLPTYNKQNRWDGIACDDDSIYPVSKDTELFRFTYLTYKKEEEEPVDPVDPDLPDSPTDPSVPDPDGEESLEPPIGDGRRLQEGEEEPEIEPINEEPTEEPTEEPIEEPTEEPIEEPIGEPEDEEPIEEPIGEDGEEPTEGEGEESTEGEEGKGEGEEEEGPVIEPPVSPQDQY